MTSGSAAATAQRRRPGKVGPRDEPGRRDGDGDRAGDDADDQEDRVDDEPRRRVVPQHVERRGAAARDPDREVGEREEQQRDDRARGQDEREWGTPPGRGHL